MKRIMMVLPLAVLLAYCSGPNNTHTSTGTDMNGNSNTVSASTTGSNTTTDVATTSTDVSDVNTNTGTISSTGTTSTSSSAGTTSNSNYGSISTTGTLDMDPSDPRYQHFQSVNGQNWTWDMNYPGYDRPTAGSYNAAINGNWQLEMTPELVSAWRQDNSRSLWSSGYASDGRYLGGNTYLSASESFNIRNTDASLNGTATTNSSTTLGSNAQGSVQINSSTNAGTISSNNTSASNSGLNNNASANTSVANQMNGSTSSSSTINGTAGNGTTGITGSTNTNGTLGSSSTINNNSTVGSTTNNNTSTTNSLNSSSVSGSVNGSDLSGSASGSANMDVNSINYNAANGNMFQLPKFNLFLDNGSFTGYTGCNSISGRVAVSGNSLHFLNTTPSTNIDCMGGLDQNVLLDLLRRVDSYGYVGDELQLMQGNQVLLRFKKGNTSLQ